MAEVILALSTGGLIASVVLAVRLALKRLEQLDALGLTRAGASSACHPPPS
jgi:hypoxanthine phosphoribosyltransferase